jgi:hypothetical protein
MDIKDAISKHMDHRPLDLPMPTHADSHTSLANACRIIV